jgi:dipeptidyl-peptidase-4
LILALNLLVPALASRADDPPRLTIDRIFGSGEFHAEGFGPARWLPDGSGYTTLEPAARGPGRDVVRYGPATGRRDVLVAAERLTPSGAKDPLTIAEYAWSADGKILLVFTNTRRVWRQNTRGDYWTLDLTSGALRKLGPDQDEAALRFAKLSPDGRRVAYVAKNNLYVENIDGGLVRALTTDGSPTLINGTFDWVYEEEWSLRDGFRWSPDGRSIAYWQIDTEGVPEYLLANDTDSLYPTLTQFPYPKVGQRNPAARVGVVDADGGATRWMDVPGDPRDLYIARMDWAANSDELVIQHVNRLQNTNDVLLCDARSGKVRRAISEHDDCWVDVGDDLQWVDQGRAFTWLSERDGWRHAYVIARSGEETRRVTEGAFDVLALVQVDAIGGWLYYEASPDNATQRLLYRVPLFRPGGPERITPADQGGTHHYQFSPDARWAIHTYSTFTRPPVTELVSLPDHKVVRTLVDNAALRDKISALARGRSQFFRVDIGEGVELDGWSLEPPGLDAAKRYPLLVHVYGEPAGQTVLDQWGGDRYLWHLMLTQQGYVVASVDNRGTPAPRGRAWRKCIYRQIGILASQDQAAALRALKARWPFIDGERVGIWGWSGGGSMTLNAILRYPELYRTGIAIAAVPDQRLYDTIYQERYMGLPQDNEKGYREGSPLTFADRLAGNLLIIHGTGDDNCHFQGCERLINALIAADKPFTMMAYPNRSHGIFEGANTTRHLFGLMTRYLNQNLASGGK